MTEPKFPWDRLLDLLAEKRVIPVVSSDLLVVERNGKPTTLEAYSAAGLARRLGLEVGAGKIGSFNQLAVARAAGSGQEGSKRPRSSSRRDRAWWGRRVFLEPLGTSPLST